MEKDYANGERNAREKLKVAKAKIEALTHQKEKEKLDILVEASLHAQNTLLTIISPILRSHRLILNFCAFQVIIHNFL